MSVVDEQGALRHAMQNASIETKNDNDQKGSSEVVQPNLTKVPHDDEITDQHEQEHENQFNPNAHEFIPTTTSNTTMLNSSLILPAPPSTCVWVGNVCPEISEQEFKAQFQQFGDVKLLRMFPRSRCAFVTFGTPEEALASQSLEDSLLGTMKLTLNVGRASRHLWVGNIGVSVNEEQLRKEFLAFGTVESVRVLRNNKCAFVNMSTEEEALAAIQALNDKQLGEHNIVINFQWNDSQRHGYSARSKGRGFKHRSIQAQTPVSVGYIPTASLPDYNTSTNTVSKFTASAMAMTAVNAQSDLSRKVAPRYGVPSKQLFVGNIEQSVSETTLWSIFAQFGEVHRIKRFFDRGYAFIIFRNLNDAIWARQQLNIYPPIVHERKLDVNFGRTRCKTPNANAQINVASGVSLQSQEASSYVMRGDTAPNANSMHQIDIPISPTFFYYPIPQAQAMNDSVNQNVAQQYDPNVMCMPPPNGNITAPMNVGNNLGTVVPAQYSYTPHRHQQQQHSRLHNQHRVPFQQQHQGVLHTQQHMPLPHQNPMSSRQQQFQPTRPQQSASSQHYQTARSHPHQVSPQRQQHTPQSIPAYKPNALAAAEIVLSSAGGKSKQQAKAAVAKHAAMVMAVTKTTNGTTTNTKAQLDNSDDSNAKHTREIACNTSTQ